MCLIRTIPAGPALCQVTPNGWGPDTMADLAACDHRPGSSPRPFASAAARAGPPPPHHLHLQRLLVSARGRRWALAQPEGHRAGSRLCKAGAPPSGWPGHPGSAVPGCFPQRGRLRTFWLLWAAAGGPGLSWVPHQARSGGPAWSPGLHHT